MMITQPSWNFQPWAAGLAGALVLALSMVSPAAAEPPASLETGPAKNRVEALATGVRGMAPRRIGVGAGVRLLRPLGGNVSLEGTADLRLWQGVIHDIGDHTFAGKPTGIGGRAMVGIRASATREGFTTFFRFAVGLDAQWSTAEEWSVSCIGEVLPSEDVTREVLAAVIEPGLGFTVAVDDWHLGAQLALSITLADTIYPIPVDDIEGVVPELHLGLVVGRDL